MTDFQRAFKALNRQQRKAVTTIEGPVMVLAGPGTGKTQTIALRIANILLKTDTDPTSILALTFTDSGAQAMYKRLIQFIGEAAYHVSISTFHTFCLNVMHENPDQFVLHSSAEPLTELERLQIFQEIIDANNFKFIRPINDPYYYLSSLIQNISALKKEGIKPPIFKQSLEKESLELNQLKDELSQTKYNLRLKNLFKNQELLSVYQQYQEKLNQLHKFDFDDMVQFVVDRFQTDQDLLLTYQERYHYLLVDEYQDTNSSQNEVVNLLSSYWGDKANIFVVGDPNQSIYRFQGASFENTLSFLEKFPEATIITLKENYRSNQTILDAAYNLISHNTFNIETILPQAESRLVANNQIISNKIQVIETLTSQSEDLFTIDKIKQLLSQGIAPSRIAVIFRTNQEIHSFANLLVKSNIKYTTQGGENLLKDPIINRLLKIFQVIHRLSTKQEDLDLFTILHYEFFDIEPLDILKISRYATEKKLTLFSVLELLINQKNEDLNLSRPNSLQKFFNNLIVWEQKSATTTFVKFFELVLNESGFLNWLLTQTDSYHHLLKLNSFFEEVKRMNRVDHSLNLGKFLNNIETLRQNNISIKGSNFNFLEEAVVLTTAHSAKGLEWDYVFIHKSIDKHWNNLRTRKLFKLPTNLVKHMDISKTEQIEEERRLFYVALTRARRQVFLTHANSYLTNSKERPALPTIFISELGKQNITKTSLQSKENEIFQNLINLLKTSKPSPQTSKAEEQFLSPLIDQLKLSPTALNTYLACPYKFKLNNLLRVPRAKKPHLAFGTAVHTALEQFFNQFKQEKVLPTKAYLLTSFEQALSKELLTKSEYERRLQEGKQILSAYYDFYRPEFKPSLFTEKKFSRIFLDDIELTGKVDRIDWLNQGQNLIRVVDYKTGKPKSRNDIEGKTKGFKGNLKRQLVFYKLLLDLDSRFKPKVGEVELDFVASPKEKNKSGKQKFVISQSEVQVLRQLIKATIGQIRHQQFPRTTDLSECVKCEFRDHCWPNGLPQSPPPQS